MQSVLVVDDHLEARKRVCNALSRACDPSEIHEAATLQAALRHIKSQAVDFAVIDLSLPDGQGESLIEPLRAKNPGCFVVVWTIHDQSMRLIEVLAKGADGYLLKDAAENTLEDAFKNIQYGKPPLSASVTRRLLEYIQTHEGEQRTEKKAPAPSGTIDEIGSLTDREIEVLKLLCQGFNRPDIAGILNISKSTVATHTANIYAKLQVNSRLEATERARALGLI